MKVIRYILNMPWTSIGLLLGVISIPKRVRIIQDAIVVDIQSFWWTNLMPYTKSARATTNGNVILLGRNLEPFDLEHELVHVRQHMERPFIQPFLYLAEVFKNGASPKNKYEGEAYRIAGNIYKGK